MSLKKLISVLFLLFLPVVGCNNDRTGFTPACDAAHIESDSFAIAPNMATGQVDLFIGEGDYTAVSHLDPGEAELAVVYLQLAIKRVRSQTND